MSLNILFATFPRTICRSKFLVQTGDEMSKRSKFVFCTWVGPNVSVMKKAKMSTDKALLKDIITNLSVELLVETAGEFTLEHFKAEVDKAGGARWVLFGFDLGLIAHNITYFFCAGTAPGWERCNSSNFLCFTLSQYTDRIGRSSGLSIMLERFVFSRACWMFWKTQNVFFVLCIPSVVRSFLQSPRHIWVKSISKTEFRQILNSFFQRYFNILMLYLLWPSTWLDVVIKSLCKSVLYLNAFETSEKIYFMCILNKSFGEKYSGQN